ncbi:MAG TPA: prephenate dehydrogenase [Symbiobacteriaceae bacterium]|jgi:prephenate dehydrogenase
MSRPVIVIWGVGLIGGALGMAWRRAGVAAEVVGIGRQPLDEAVRLGAIDRYVTDPAEGIAQADVLVLCAPVTTIIEQARRFARYVKPGAVVTDVGSTKLEIVWAWEEYLPAGASFVGGHPMFGREVTGVQNATPDLPKGCRWVLTPGRRDTPEALARIAALAEAAGGAVRVMSPVEHDDRVAVISHLPQVVATALAAAALQCENEMGGVLDLAAGGFRDTTRIAGSSAEIWTDIFLTNGGGVRAALASFRESLDALEAAVADGDAEAIAAIFARANEARRRLPT